MHIPLLVLGITPETVRLTRHLSKTKGLFDSSEIEFFSDFNFYLDKSGLARDPGSASDEDSESRIPTINTLLEHATGRSPKISEVELWSHFFAHKSRQ